MLSEEIIGKISITNKDSKTNFSCRFKWYKKIFWWNGIKKLLELNPNEKDNFIEKTKKEFLDDNNNDNDINNFDMIIETNFKKGKKFKLNE